MLTRQFPGAARKQQKPYGVREVERATAKGRNARYQKKQRTRDETCAERNPTDAPTIAQRRTEQLDGPSGLTPPNKPVPPSTMANPHDQLAPLEQTSLEGARTSWYFLKRANEHARRPTPLLERATSPAEHADTFSESPHHTCVKCDRYTARRSKPARHGRANTKGPHDGIASHSRTA